MSELIIPLKTELERIYNSCVDQLRAFVHAAGFRDVVIGLSGGMDSALVAVMARDAFGAPHVHGVLLPGPYSSNGSVTDAEELAANLGVVTHTFPIGQIFDVFAHRFTDAADAPMSELAAQNTQARCRTVAIMAFSNTFDWLMLNTGNKSEAAMGYSTLYGDTAGAFAPLGGLYKTQVYQLANWLNRRAQAAGETPPIPQNIIDKPPSAELSPDQTDEASLGIDYVTLDSILVELVDNGRPVAEAAEALGFPLEQVADVECRYQAAAFKRALEPPYADVHRG